MWDNFWNLRVNDRLTRWRTFRSEISKMSLKRAVEEVNMSWGGAPIATFYLDDSMPETWPNPWTLLAENYYCDFSKSLGMLYTLYFSEHKKTAMKLQTCYDHSNKERLHLVNVDNGKYFLNYCLQEIVNTEQVKNFKLLNQYSSCDLQLEKY